MFSHSPPASPRPCAQPSAVRSRAHLVRVRVRARVRVGVRGRGRVRARVRVRVKVLAPTIRMRPTAVCGW